MIAVNDNNQEIRQKLDETKAQLFTKLQLLVDQIAKTIETTGTQVKSTVGAVENAVHSVSNALDVRRQFERHPWWWLGGAVSLGYVVGGMRHRKVRDSKQNQSAALGIASLDSATSDDNVTGQASSSSLSALSAAYELGSKQSTANQARTLAVNVTARVFEEIVSRSVPIVIAYLARKQEERH
jgi:hypothetical protein